MHEEIIQQRNIGINFSSAGTAQVRLWAPDAQSAEIHVEGKKTLSLNPCEFGYWELQTTLLHPGDDYRFSLDELSLFPDPASLFQPFDVHGPSRAYDLRAFTWSDSTWRGIEPDELIIYELHTGTFTGEGTFEAIAGKLNYLKNLGITALEIMPVAQFPGPRNWGYDGVFPFAVQNSYGGPCGLQRLVDICHREKIAVILDVVCNHLGPEGNYLENYGPYFTDKYKTPWGKAVNFDDAWCDGVRRFYIENVLMWFRDFHLDGLRLDAVHAIRDFSAKHILEDIREHVNKLADQTHRNYLLIGESDLNDVRYIKSTGEGGYGLDQQWCDEFHHALHALVTGERKGYYADFGSIYSLVKSFNDAYVFDGIYSPHRKKTFGNKTTGLPGSKFIVFAQNHDQIGNRMLGERLTTLVGFEMVKLITGALFLSPFIPLLFMGEEYGETAPFLYFTSHTDPQLIMNVQEGRKNEFREFMDAEEIPDPQSPETFLSSKLKWGYQTDINQRSLLSYYKTLIRLRKNHPLLKKPSRENSKAEVINDTNAVLFVRNSDNHLLIAIMNFEARPINVDLSAYAKVKLHLLLNSGKLKWSGSAENNYHLQNNIVPQNRPGFPDDPISGNTNHGDIAFDMDEWHSTETTVQSIVCVNPHCLLLFSDVEAHYR